MSAQHGPTDDAHRCACGALVHRWFSESGATYAECSAGGRWMTPESARRLAQRSEPRQ